MKYPHRIFLIDDDEDDGYIFDIALTSISHHIQLQHYTDSESALTKLGDNTFEPPDLVFIDWNMPKIDGHQCLQAIRNNPRYMKTPIVICSTSNHLELREQVQQLGASHFLPKPSTVNELKEQLEVLLRS